MTNMATASSVITAHSALTQNLMEGDVPKMQNTENFLKVEPNEDSPLGGFHTANEAYEALEKLIQYLEVNPGLSGDYLDIFKLVLTNIGEHINSTQESRLAFEHVFITTEQILQCSNVTDCKEKELPLLDTEYNSDSTIYNDHYGELSTEQNDIHLDSGTASSQDEGKDPKKAGNKVPKVKRRRKKSKSSSEKKLDKVKCPHCDRAYSTKYYLAQHIKSHTGKSDLKCDVCDKEFIYNIHLMRHKRQTHPQNHLKCHVCGEGLENEEKLNRHLENHNKPEKCDYCPKSFSGKVALRTHLRRHHPDREKIPKVNPYKCPEGFKCSDCEKIYSKFSRLKSHMRNHTGERPFVCQLCSKAFMDNRTLKHHIECHTQDRHHQCTICEKSFRKSYNLKIHQRVHSGDRPYNCELCDKRFRYPPGLTLHMRAVHEGIKKYLCTDCGQEFSQERTLQEHMLVHAGIKPFQCDMCPKTFTRTGSLRVHRLRHLGKFRHQCTLCTRMFMNPAEVDKHIAVVHSRQSTVTCPACGGTFADVKHYKVHQCGKPKLETLGHHLDHVTVDPEQNLTMII